MVVLLLGGKEGVPPLGRDAGHEELAVVGRELWKRHLNQDAGVPGLELALGDGKVSGRDPTREPAIVE